MKSIVRDIKKITYRVDSRFVWDIYNIWSNITSYTVSSMEKR